MAVIAAVVVDISGDGSVKKITWGPMLNGDTGEIVKGFDAQWIDRSVQVVGTFGVGGNLRWAGSNNSGANFVALSDPQGVLLNIIAADIKAVTEIAEQSRPEVTAGDGTTSLTVTLIQRRQQPLFNS